MLVLYIQTIKFMFRPVMKDLRSPVVSKSKYRSELLSGETFKGCKSISCTSAFSSSKPILELYAAPVNLI